MGEDRHFRPDARYAANDAPGVRWHDERTGQEHWSRPVGVDTLLDAGADYSESITAPDAVRIISRVEIGPYQPPSGRWKAEVTWTWLDVRGGGSAVVRFLTTQAAVESHVADSRAEAVDWAEGRCAGFEEAETRDPVEKRRKTFSRST